MTFPRVRPPNGWSFASVINPSECEQIDTNLSNAIDGRDGGAYAPTATIVIGASGGNTVGLHVTSHAILDSLEGHVTNSHVLTVDSGGEIVVANNGAALVQDGGVITLASNVAHGGGQVQCFGVIAVSGPGSQLNLGINSTTTFGGSSLGFATLNLGAYSITTFDGISGHNAALVLGQNSNTEIDGAVEVTTTGVVTVLTGGTFAVQGAANIASGGTFTQQAGGKIVLADLAGPTTDPGGAGRLYATNVCKAWALVQMGVTPSIVGGYNIASVSIGGTGNESLSIVFARGFADANYCAVGNTSGPFRWVVTPNAIDASTMRVRLSDDDSGGFLDLTSVTTLISIVVFGRG